MVVALRIGGGREEALPPAVRVGGGNSQSYSA